MRNLIIDIYKADLFLEQTQILFDINWKAARSEHWFILGPNGAGKTTLTRMLLGYIWPKFGARISVLGNVYGECDLYDVRKKLAWVSPYLQNWTAESRWNVEEVIISGFDSTVGLFRPPKKVELMKVKEVLQKLSSDKLFGRKFVSLSSGEQVKVLIARALVSDPEIMILDEACAHLDLKSREFFLETIDAFAKRKDSPAIIFVTQRIEDITPSFEKGLALKNGRILFCGNRDEVLTESNLSSVFGLPVKLFKSSSGRYWPVIEH